ncbi:hypothetical protein [Wolbachia endosymbiont of Encarsia formosa]|uniref:hypothetical protein n=1 Tax=Wolbachia endosymbiont of Encarsia formosa TaxID=77125 RepID=UPI0031BA5639
MEKQEIIEILGRKLVSAISRGDFQKVKECIKEIEYKQIKNEVFFMKNTIRNLYIMLLSWVI